MNARSGTQPRSLLMCGLLACVASGLALAGCSSGGVAPPDIEDTWQAPQGYEDDVPRTCDDNRDLFAYDAQAPLDVQETSRRLEEGVAIIDLTYASPMGGRVPATLVVPDGPGPFAGMLYQHGMPSTRQPLIPGAVTYARLGAVVLMIDAPFARRENGLDESLIFAEQDRREQIQLVVDLRRGIDLLLSQPHVDPERLAYVGISYGGAMGGLLAGLENRLKAYVLQVGDGGLVTHSLGPEDTQWWTEMPEDVRQQWLAWMWPIEPILYVGCAAPAALLFQNGTQDAMVPPADALRYQQAGSEPKTILWYEAGHGLGVDAFQDQARWLADIIGIAGHGSAMPPSVRVVLYTWGTLTAGSLVYLAWRLRKRRTSAGASFLWVLTTLFLGPVAAAIYQVVSSDADDSSSVSTAVSPARRAIGSAAWAAAGNMVGGIGVLAILLYAQWFVGGNILRQLVITTLLPLCSGALIFAAAKWLSRSDPPFEAAFRRPILAEAVSTFLVLAGAYPTVTAMETHYLGPWTSLFNIDLSYPPLWGTLVLAALAGALIAYPYHLWMIRRGVVRWGVGPAVDAGGPRGLAWYFQLALVVLSFAVMVGAVVLSQQVAWG